jgi:hypothetical protein
MKYRRKTTTETAGDSSSPHTAAVSSRVPAMGLADKYGLRGMSIKDPSDSQTQTIEQEYQGYITAPLSDTTDLLKFWEVREYSMILMSA